MCLQELYLVNPRLYPSAEATARASGADDILAQTQVCDSLQAALIGCTLVFGASARPRTIAWPELSPRECAQRMVTESTRAKPALLMGPEHSGLSNVELERCNYLVHIPSNPQFSSLNIAAALQVLAYEILLASLEEEPVNRIEQERVLPTAEEMELFYEHLERTLIEIEFLDPASPRQLMRRLHRLFNHAQLDKSEMNILRGILAAAQRRQPSHGKSEA